MNNKLNTNFSLRKLLLTALVAGPLATLPAPLWALPDVASTNLTTSSGVTTQVVGSTLNITSPDKAILTWQAFGSGLSPIAAGDVINYFLPSSTSSVLNSVSGGVASTINGSLISNGNVYVLNPAGIVIGATAQINTGGFYASTVAEPSGFFSINGSLSFAGTSTSSVTVKGTGTTSGVDAATIQAVGSGNNIYLAGNQVIVEGGKFFGNLFTRASGAGTNTTFASTGAVSVALVGAIPAGGGLDVRTAGGDVVLTGAATGVTIAPSQPSSTGAVSINTTGTSTNGSITQGAAQFTASTTGTVTTLNAGTGTTAGNITLGNTNFLTVGASGNNISITETSGLVLNTVNAAGNFTLAIGTGNDQSMASGATVTAGGNVDVLARGVSITGTGNLTFSNIVSASTLTVSTPGSITINGAAISNTRSISLTSSGGNVTVVPAITTSTLTLAAPAGAITVTGLSTSGTATDGVGGVTTISALGDISLNGGATTRSNAGQNTNMTVTSSTGNISFGAITNASGLTMTATAGSITTTAISTQTLTLTAANGSVSTGAISAAGNTVAISGGSVTVGAVSIGNAGLTLTATTGNLTTGAISSGTAAATLSAPSATGSVITNGTIVKGSTSAVFTISAGSDINLGNNNIANTITVPTLSVTSTNGSITQTAAITSTSRTILTAARDITLTNAANDFGNVALVGGANSTTAGFSITDAGSITLGNGNNATAPVTVTSGAANAAASDIIIGNAAVDTLRFGSTLTLKMNNVANTGAITTNANNVSIFGNVSITTLNNNNATLGSDIFGNASNYTYGQINASIGTGALKVYENQTLNLGTITAANLDARSLSSDIVNTGALNITGGGAGSAAFVATFGGNSVFSANSIFSPGNVTLNATGNTLAGSIVLGNAKDVSITNGAATTVVAGSTGINGKAVTGTTFVKVTTGALIFNTAAGGDFGSIGFDASGAVTINDSNGITLQNISTPSTNAAAISVTAAGPITLGSGINLNGTGTASFTSTGASAAITDSAPNIRIFGPANFTSDNSISITNPGHSVGAVGLTTTNANGTNGSANISYYEGGTANLATVSVGTTASLTVVSSGGDVKQNTGGTITVPTAAGASNSASFTAATGVVTLANAGNSIAAPVNISAVGNSSITQANATALVLGNVTVSAGTFAASAPAFGSTISQATGSAIKVYGATTVSDSGKITLSNTGNNFGGLTFTTNSAVTGTATTTVGAGAVTAVAPVVATPGTGYAPNSTFAVTLVGGGGAGATANATTNSLGTITSYTVTAGGAGYVTAPTVTVPATPSVGADVAITEAGTLNFLSVNTGTGKLTAISENGAIIQSGTGGITVGGATSLTAGTAGITLNTGTTNNSFGGNNGILITTTGNASVQDSNAITALAGGSTVGGTLTLKNTQGATGQIKDTPGNITVTGNVLLDTTTAAGTSINLGSSNLSLGAIQFRSGAVTIVENASLNLAAGSVASGAVSLTSSGNITTTGAGGGTFQNTLQLNASGSITITNPIFVNGALGSGLTFRSLGAVDLSALSLAGNLNSIAPTNLGASSYKAPSP